MNSEHPNANWTTRVAVVKRTAKTVKSGRRFSFGALVVVGNGLGCIGLGWGKASEVASALEKAEREAAAQTVQVSLQAGRISHEVRGQYCGATVLLRPAPPGTGLIAGRAVRDVLECAGVKDVVGKSLGARNPANVAKATIRALMSLRIKTETRKSPVLKLPHFNCGDPLRLN